MIPPTPGPDPASRLFGMAAPPDGAGPIGPDTWWPQRVDPPPEQLEHAKNPLQYVPVVGTIYRAVTGEQIPITLQVAGAALTGGPVGALLAGFGGILMALLTMKPDLSRPALPAGMSGSAERGMEPVSPGALVQGAYTTLATSAPDWLQPPTLLAAHDTARGTATYRLAAQEYDRAQWLEKGIA